MLNPESLLEYDFGNEIVAFSTKRSGGVSKDSYASFNINPFCGDNPEHISHNHTLLCDFLQIPQDHLLLPRQVHADKVVQVCNMPVSPEDLDGYDAVITTLPNVCIGVSTADCVPILLYVRGTTEVIAAVHAGWRGTQQRIVEKTIEVLVRDYNVQPENIFAAIGPCIHREAFEVGDEVYQAFLDAGFDMPAIAEKMQGRWHIDLPLCNRLQLTDCGVPDTQIQQAPFCTFKQHPTFFSARRLGIHSGRIYTGIMLKENASTSCRL